MQVGPYEIERELGRGGAGTVLLARDPRSGRSVVVKTLEADADEARGELGLAARLARLGAAAH